jgi:hypothetical protein
MNCFWRWWTDLEVIRLEAEEEFVLSDCAMLEDVD